MARTWTGKTPPPPPPGNGGDKDTKSCSRCRGTGTIRVVSAKTVEHGGFEPYDENCADCEGKGVVDK